MEKGKRLELEWKDPMVRRERGKEERKRTRMERKFEKRKLEKRPYEGGKGN